MGLFWERSSDRAGGPWGQLRVAGVRSLPRDDSAPVGLVLTDAGAGLPQIQGDRKDWGGEGVLLA